MCLRELPEVEAIQKEFRAQGVLVVAAGSGDAWRVDSLRYNKRLSMAVPVASDAFRQTLGVAAFPETLFIDRKGRVAERLRGGADAAYFRARVQYLLQEPLDDATADALGATGKPATPSTNHGLFNRAVYEVVKLFN